MIDSVASRPFLGLRLACCEQDLRKIYRGGKVAVDGVSFGIPVGQCFGFLVMHGVDDACFSYAQCCRSQPLQWGPLSRACCVVSCFVGYQRCGQDDDAEGAVWRPGADVWHGVHRGLRRHHRAAATATLAGVCHALDWRCHLGSRLLVKQPSPLSSGDVV